MPRLVSVLFFLLLPVSVQANLLLGYSFDDSTSATASDTSEYGNHGGLVNGATHADGQYGSGLYLDGRNDYVYVPHTESLNVPSNGAISISLWASIPTRGGWDVILTKGDWNQDYSLFVDKNNRIGFVFGNTYQQTNVVLPASTLTHLAVTYDGTSTVTLYINGAVAYSGNLYPQGGATNSDIYIGQLPSGHDRMKGTLDNLRIYGRQLTAQDVANDMATAIGTPQPTPVDNTPPVLSDGSPSGEQPAGTSEVILSLNTDEAAYCRYSTTPDTNYDHIPSSFTANESTEHSVVLAGISNGTDYNYYVRCKDTSNNATISDYVISFSVDSAAPETDSAATIALALDENSGWEVNNSAASSPRTGSVHGASWTSGRYGSALSFDGNGDYVSLPSDSNTNFSNAISMLAWVSSSEASGWDVVLSKGAWNEAYSIYLDNNNQLQMYIAGIEVDTGHRLTPDTLTHIAVTYDGARIITYLDGVEIHSRNHSASISTVDAPLYVGRVTGGDYFSGIIDEVQIFDQALSEAQIQAYMQQAIVKGEPDVTAPTISDVAALPLVNGAIVSWKTNELANGSVMYGLSSAYDGEITVSEYKNTHSVSIANLLPETTYSFSINNADSLGNAASTGNLTFTTLAQQSTESHSLNFSANDAGDHDYAKQTAIPQGFGGDEFTLELWIKPDTSYPVGPVFNGSAAQLTNWSNVDNRPNAGSDWWYSGNFLLDGHNNGSFNNGTFSLQFYGGGYLRWLFGDGDGLWAVQTYPAASNPNSVNLLDGQWHHVALVRRWTGSDKAILEMYIDGILSTSTAVDNRVNMRHYWDSWSGYPNRQDGWFWGAEKQAAIGVISQYEDYKGLLDDISFWSRAKSSVEIQDTYNHGITNTTGLVGRYQIDEGNGSQTCDSINPEHCMSLYRMNGDYWRPGRL